MKRCAFAFSLCAIFCLIAIFPAMAAEGRAWSGPGLNVTGGSELWIGDTYMDSRYATGAHLLHSIGVTGYGVSAAVLDEPFDINHEALRDRVIAEASAGFSFVGTDEGITFTQYANTMSRVDADTYWEKGLNAVAVPGLTDASRAEYGGIDYAAVFDEISHGTHVAGTIVAMAPEAGLVLVTAASWKEADAAQRDSDDLAAFIATDYALNHIADMAGRYNIVAMNNSWGNRDFSENLDFDDDTIAAVARLRAANVATVFASGNSGMNDLGKPSNYPDVFPVGALRPDGLVAEFSNQPLAGNAGKKVFLMAPGVDINSSIPYPDVFGDPQYGTMDGTSMAAPHMTGAYALLASGARNAHVLELFRAIYESADVFQYDGGAMLTPEQTGYDSTGYQRFWSTLHLVDAFSDVELNIDNADDGTVSRSLDDWREITRLSEIFRFARSGLIDNGGNSAPTDQEIADAARILLQNDEAANAAFPYLGPLGQAEFRFLRVDKAYMYLTEDRMNTRASGLPGGSGPRAILRAFGGELGAALDYETSQIFQRLDAQSNSRLARAARQMSPQWDATALEYGQLGVIGLHRSLGRRGEIRRLHAASIAGKADDPCEPCRLDLAAFWIEGFGSFADRSGTGRVSDYDGHFAGTSVGVEKRMDRHAFGVFGSWADYRAKGSDGVSDGDWYSAGLYGSLAFDGFFLDASVAYNHADYDTNRNIVIPGTIFTTPYPDQLIVMDPYSRRSGSDRRVNGVSARLGGGYDFDLGCGWTLGPRMEGALSNAGLSGHRDRGAGALGIAVDRYRRTYVEAGAGLAVSRAFDIANCRSLVASLRIMGMYGTSFGDDLRGSYLAHGSEFRFSPERHAGMWCLPEASLSWDATDRIAVSATYAGRFGKHYIENTGSLSVSISF